MVYAALSIAVGDLATARQYGGGQPENTGKALSSHVHLPDRSAATEAAELIARFGVHAAGEAAARADHSREVGNVDHFCRWRQIERLILLLSDGRAGHSLH